MHMLSERRQAKGWTWTALAEESGVSRSTIYRIEVGKLDGTVPTLRKLATALDCSVADLLDEEA